MDAYVWRAAENEPASRLGAYVQKCLPLLPAHVVRSAFENRDVKMDGQRVRPEDAVRPGAEMQLFTPFAAALPVVYEDERVVLINKPAGLCVEDENAGMTVLSMMRRRAGEAYIPRLCHRLDTQTCGLMILAKDDESQAALDHAFRERTLKKEYTCLVRGEMRPPEKVCRAYLIKNARVGRVRVISHETPGARPIVTAYRTLSREGELSRLQVDLLTGRTHQIRAHLAYLSHPILGDDVYGDRAFNRRLKSVGRLKLCASSLTLRFQDGPLAGLDGRCFEIQPPF